MSKTIEFVLVFRFFYTKNANYVNLNGQNEVNIKPKLIIWQHYVVVEIPLIQLVKPVFSSRSNKHEIGVQPLALAYFFYELLAVN